WGYKSYHIPSTEHSRPRLRGEDPTHSVESTGGQRAQGPGQGEATSTWRPTPEARPLEARLGRGVE
ncbi:hypothetical protein KI387_007721, partial [Taxus chinensis]